MKPIQFYSNNPILQRLLQLTLDLKEADSIQLAEPPAKLPYYYQGPVLIDDDVTILYLLPILDYIEARLPGTPIFSTDPKIKAQTMMFVHGLLVDKANQNEVIKYLQSGKGPFAFSDDPNIVDITIAAITQDIHLQREILKCK